MTYAKQTIFVPRKTTLFELTQYRGHSGRKSVLSCSSVITSGKDWKVGGNHPDSISLSIPGHFRTVYETDKKTMLHTQKK